MLLVIDVGNTDLTIGLYHNEDLTVSWRLATDHQRLKDEYGIQFSGLLEHAGLKPENLKGIVVSSVVPMLTGRTLEACEQYLHTKPLLITPDIKMPIKIGYDDPYAVGSDRIADAVAVQTYYGGPACIIDFGTATTFNALDENKVYLGGSIMPGLGISAEALVNKAAKLNQIELKAPPAVIGTNTTHAMQSGLVFGYASMVSGMIGRFKQVLGPKTKVIATGGLVSVIAPHVPEIEVTNPDLTMDGIRLLWEMNS